MFWSNLTEAQATLLAGGLTLLAALAAVFLGNWVFGGRVSTMEAAMNTAKEQLDSHIRRLEAAIQKIGENVDDIQETATVISQRTADVSGRDESKTDIVGQSVTHSEVESPAVPDPTSQPDDTNQDHETLRALFFEEWEKIRSNIENLAAEPAIDGRTRARYARIDRRNYGDLVSALRKDGRLGTRSKDYEEAVSLRATFRNNKRTMTDADLEKMRALREKFGIDT